MKLLRIDEFTQINEGAGAGYELEFKGVNINPDSVSILPGWVKYDRNDNKAISFEVNIVPGELDYWSANGYYDGIDSDYSGFDLSTKIDGGKFVCVISMECINDYINVGDEYDVLDHDDLRTAVVEFLYNCNTADIDLNYTYGCGWSHQNLDDMTKLGLDIDDFNNHKDYTKVRSSDVVCDIEDVKMNYASVIYAELQIPEIAKDVNAFFANPQRYYDDAE